jgi:hypothetical protein
METFNFTVAYSVSTATLDRLVETAVDQVVHELSEIARVNTDGVRDLCRDLIVNRLAAQQIPGATAAANPSHVALGAGVDASAAAANILHVGLGVDATEAHAALHAQILHVGLGQENHAPGGRAESPAENPAPLQQTIPFAPGIMSQRSQNNLLNLVRLLNAAQWVHYPKLNRWPGFQSARLRDDPGLAAFAFRMESAPEKVFVDHRHPVILDAGVFSPWVKTTRDFIAGGVVFPRSAARPNCVTSQYLRSGKVSQGLAFKTDALKALGMIY